MKILLMFVPLFFFCCNPLGYKITEDKLEGFTDIEQTHQLEYEGSNFFSPVCETTMTFRKHIKNNTESYFITFYVDINESLRVNNEESLLIASDTIKKYFSAIENTVNKSPNNKYSEILIYPATKKDIINIYNANKTVFRLKGETGYRDYVMKFPKEILKKFVDKI